MNSNELRHVPGYRKQRVASARPKLVGVNGLGLLVLSGTESVSKSEKSIPVPLSEADGLLEKDTRGNIIAVNLVNPAMGSSI